MPSRESTTAGYAGGVEVAVGEICRVFMQFARACNGAEPRWTTEYTNTERPANSSSIPRIGSTWRRCGVSQRRVIYVALIASIGLDVLFGIVANAGGIIRHSEIIGH
jgi:hypothetical protein